MVIPTLPPPGYIYFRLAAYGKVSHRTLLPRLWMTGNAWMDAHWNMYKSRSASKQRKLQPGIPMIMGDRGWLASCIGEYGTVSVYRESVSSGLLSELNVFGGWSGEQVSCCADIALQSP